ncbi:hypothetical protein [Geodermatophilus sabuli]|uniref:Signal transduction histidine kinase subgroup 3 dimerisation and phosphoacceptor domain-containing protein n=1 Tax=Geodermatophilus sabuli TaxID=1564158 RepID=A0A285EF16_9ACTN|nr:hypothetical protein [Geodermatophilus sabuli]MBB3086216.1 signal transduction histidine kinase [Geodermatophilus sabuli]SNX97567.1 hypothetical protein SAMN06893097_107211 [Geodermatophilus sabuli]
MPQATTIGLVRGLLVTVVVAVVLVVVVRGGAGATGSVVARVLLPFAAAAIAAAALHLLVPRTPTRYGAAIPYATLAEAVRRMQSGSLEQALPALAQVVADGTRAARAVVWLAVGGRLVAAAWHPSAPGAGEDSVADLTALLARPDTAHVVPVLDGPVLRAALTIRKDVAVTAADRRLMHDAANAAGLLLRVVALNAELAERMRRAADLAEELQASRQRLATVRDSERRRLVAELAHATSDRLDVLRAEIAAASAALSPGGASSGGPDPARAQAALARARDQLDDLLERFRAVARGVYPAVLRDRGPAAALDEVVADLPRAVRLTGGLEERLPWELESGIYYAAAAAARALGGQPAESPLVVRLEHCADRITVHVEDAAPPVPPDRLAALLTADVDRLAALGGGMDLVAAPTGLHLMAWLPDRVEPVVIDADRTEAAVR